MTTDPILAAWWAQQVRVGGRRTNRALDRLLHADLAALVARVRADEDDRCAERVMYVRAWISAGRVDVHLGDVLDAIRGTQTQECPVPAPGGGTSATNGPEGTRGRVRESEPSTDAREARP